MKGLLQKRKRILDIDFNPLSIVKELLLKFSSMYAKTGRQRKSKEEMHKELFLRKRSRKGLHTGRVMLLVK